MQPRLARSLTVAIIVLCNGAPAAESPERVFRENCANCHASGFPPGLTEARIAHAIRDGLPEKGMPAFGAKFSATQLGTLAKWILTGASGSHGGMLGKRVEGEALNALKSSNYAIAIAESSPATRYVGNVDANSMLCYDGIDLSGARSIELEYARGENGEYGGRIAVLARDNGGLGPAVNLGEKITRPTGGWETFRRHRVGLSRSLTGSHTLCFFGLDGGGIFNLDHFALSDKPGQNDGLTLRFNVPPAVFSAASHDFTLAKVAEAPGELWAMALLADGSIITTQKNGNLWLVREGRLQGPVRGTPPVWNRGDGGLLDVRPHPDHARNGWVYIAYAHADAAGNAMTAISRGRIRDLAWIDDQPIYRAPSPSYGSANSHFGSRIALHDGFVYFTVGDRVQADLAQDLSAPHGKIHRLHDDGRVPADNPFVNDARALPSIWSYGHRNSQGLALQAATGELWSTDHGPKGGDELNLVRKGANYGWPIVSFGTHYDDTPISASPYKEGVEAPVHHWTPSIGISQLQFFSGTAFPRWRGRLFVSSLGRQELHLLRFDAGAVMADDVVFQGLGRIRDVTVGPDGHPYVILNNPNGTIYRLVPASRNVSR